MRLTFFFQTNSFSSLSKLNLRNDVTEQKKEGQDSSSAAKENERKTGKPGICERKNN
jgi:hypothetical protein